MKKNDKTPAAWSKTVNVVVKIKINVLRSINVSVILLRVSIHINISNLQAVQQLRYHTMPDSGKSVKKIKFRTRNE